jgi:molybdate transport system permease protein
VTGGRALLAGLPLLALLVMPLAALLGATDLADLRRAAGDPSFAAALRTSLWTTSLSLLLLVGFGTPLAWWLARGGGPWRALASRAVDLPIVMPPAVVGLALLIAFAPFGLALTSAAVVIAQTVVAAPFYVHGAAASFRRIDPDMLLVARTLGRSPSAVFRVVVLPLALPGLVTAAGLAWARALGEFGATLLFAGNLEGVTQTAPLGVYAAMTSDLRLAVALALVLVLVGVLLLSGLPLAHGFWRRRGGGDS